MIRFLLPLLLFAAPLFAADPTPSEAELIALVKKLGGTAAIDPNLDDQARVAATFEKPTDDTLFALCKQPELGSLDLRAVNKLSVTGVSVLWELPDLQRLYLSGGTLTAEHAAAVATIRPLAVLTVGCKITDREVLRFGKLKHLKALDLLDTGVSDKCLEGVLALSKLEELNLSGTKISDAGAKKLLALEKLKLLQLNNTKVSATAIGQMEDELKASKRGLKILR